MFGLKLSVRGHQHVFQLEIPELQAFHGKIELGPEIIIMAPALLSPHLALPCLLACGNKFAKFKTKC